MSEISLTLVLQIKTSKIINDMAKLQKIIQKNAFGKDINTIPTLKCAFCQEKRYIEDGEAPIL